MSKYINASRLERFGQEGLIRTHSHTEAKTTSNTPDPADTSALQPMGQCLHSERKGCDHRFIKALTVKIVFMCCFLFYSSILNSWTFLSWHIPGPSTLSEIIRSKKKLVIMLVVLLLRPEAWLLSCLAQLRMSQDAEGTQATVFHQRSSQSVKPSCWRLYNHLTYYCFLTST